MKKIYKNENNNIFTFTLLLVVAIMVLSLCFMNNNLVFAEDTDTILNFNQLITNDYNHNYSYTYVSGSTRVTMTNAIGDSGENIYYIRIIKTTTNQIALYAQDTDGNISVFAYTSDTEYESLTTKTDLNYFSIAHGADTDYTSIILINLTTMYGSGNEPSLTECSSIFTAQYYGYTTGTAITESGFTSYSSGYAQAISDLESSMEVTAQSLNSYYLFSYILMDGQTSDDISMEKDYFDDYNMYATLYSDETYGFLPFSVAANTKLTLTIGAFGVSVEDDTYPFNFYISYLYNGSLIPLQTIELSSSSSVPLNDVTYSFYIPVDIDGIVFHIDSNEGYYVLGNVEASYTTYNILDLVSMSQTAAYQEGVESVDTDSYYQEGYYDGLADGKLSSNEALESGFWTWFNSMLSGIGNIFNIELYNGITIGIVILIPLLFSILLLVLRLVRGG